MAPAWVAARGGHIDGVLADLARAKASLETPGGTGMVCPPLWASAAAGDLDVVRVLRFLNKAVVDN